MGLVHDTSTAEEDEEEEEEEDGCMCRTKLI
jgi:hypothetical protein